MISNRPYLLRALYDWILDNNMTPHLVVDTTVDGIQVPAEYIEDNQIVLNILPSAVKDLQLGNDAVSFNARFNGKAQPVYVPIQSVIAIYARENGKGLIFPEEVDADEETAGEDKADDRKPHLKVIK